VMDGCKTISIIVRQCTVPPITLSSIIIILCLICTSTVRNTVEGNDHIKLHDVVY
jgi:hypothetical protein